MILNELRMIAVALMLKVVTHAAPHNFEGAVVRAKIGELARILMKAHTWEA